MSEGRSFNPPEITDDDIRRASRLLGLPESAFHGESGADPRQEVLKSMDRIDVAACPGSGKTTLLVAKLAILAEKWRDRSRGICVLSHTNAARQQIETRLGDTGVGQRLLAYPHFVGTIHGFMNRFLALPWLRSQGFQVQMIDSDACLDRRWWALQTRTRKALERNRHDRSVLTIKTPDFGLGDIRWGKGTLGKETETYQEMRRVCQRSATDGHFCHEEMFVWAEQLLVQVSAVTTALRNRFPVLLVDEAQDNSETQSAMLRSIFAEERTSIIRQRFGDSNQAIYNSVQGKDATTDRFPDIARRRDLPSSFRFDQTIASLADPLGVDPCGLEGCGPKTTQIGSQSKHCHTIFLFDENSVANVLDAYAALLLETFSDRALRDGRFTAVGLTHRPRANQRPGQFPGHVGDYWPSYDARMASREPKPSRFAQYVDAGRASARLAGETHLGIEKIAEGILRLAGMTNGGTALPRRRGSHRHVLELLAQNVRIRDEYLSLNHEVVVMQKPLTQESWVQLWCNTVRQIAETIAGCPLAKREADEFLRWGDDGASSPSTQATSTNIYRYPQGSPKVDIHVGSVHSVKGETHTATLVLETFWNKHNLAALGDWIRGSKNGWVKKDGVQQRARLKVHYVAMTRPSHLLCLAMKRSSSRDADDDELKLQLEEHGWQVSYL